MRQAVSREALIIKLFHGQPIRSQGPPAVGGYPAQHGGKRRIQPDHGAVAEHQLAIAGVLEGAAARRHNNAALGQQLNQRLAFASPEIRFALLAENGGNVAPFRTLDARVDVLDLPVQPAAECPGRRGFTGPHEADEVDLVGSHALAALPAPRSARRSRSSKNAGYETAIASAPSICVGPVAPRAAIAKAIASR